jgi:hypothetical protein
MNPLYNVLMSNIKTPTLCQHCNNEVVFGTPADGSYKRFLHVANNSDECPTEESNK